MIDVLGANVIVHSKMADTYNEREPHFRPENKEKVRGVLKRLRDRTGPILLDVGCGTGFIIDLAKDIFDEIHGVDITEAMLEKVDTFGGNITLHNTQAQNLPFEDNSFDLVTAYAFLHHLEDYRPVLKEIFRVLKPGGSFYADLEPNCLFWDLIKAQDFDRRPKCSDLVKREVQSVCHTDEAVYDEYGIDKNIFNQAEYIKSIRGGISGDEIYEAFVEIGFDDVEVTYQWYAGQGKIIHEQSEQDAVVVENYLNELLPLSRSLFKYLRFIAKKRADK